MALAAGLAGLAAAPLPAHAHPHAWVKASAEIIYSNGSITALRNTWIFDAYYTSGATEGLDKNGDGKLDASELAELTQVNMDGLKEFGYFTDVRLGRQVLNFAAPKDPIMAMVDVPVAEAPQSGSSADEATAGALPPSTATKANPAPVRRTASLLSLTFTLPLAEPVLADAKGFELSVRDPSIFIWFELAAKDPVRLVGAPSGCGYTIGEPTLSEEQKRLDDAFGRTGGLDVITGGTFKTIRLACGQG